MSGTEGKRESPISSPREKEKLDLKPYRHKLVKKLVDAFYRPSKK